MRSRGKQVQKVASRERTVRMGSDWPVMVGYRQLGIRLPEIAQQANYGACRPRHISPFSLFSSFGLSDYPFSCQYRPQPF
jgi:hypothetical protein